MCLLWAVAYGTVTVVPSCPHALIACIASSHRIASHSIASLSLVKQLSFDSFGSFFAFIYLVRPSSSPLTLKCLTCVFGFSFVLTYFLVRSCFKNIESRILLALQDRHISHLRLWLWFAVCRLVGLSSKLFFQKKARWPLFRSSAHLFRPLCLLSQPQSRSG